VFVLSIIGVCGVAGAPAGIAGADEPLHIRKGLFLVAAPDLTDPNFSETVILITHHGPQGTTGVVINRPTTTLLSRALPDLPALADRPETLFMGGPVGREAVVMLMRTREPHESARRVFGDVYESRRADALARLLTQTDPVFRFYAGSAGWASGQLEDELDRGSWRVLPADSAVVFDRDPDVIWSEMIRRSSERFVRAGFDDQVLPSPPDAGGGAEPPPPASLFLSAFLSAAGAAGADSFAVLDSGAPVSDAALSFSLPLSE
jgi:putative transcriptional regulator